MAITLEIKKNPRTTTYQKGRKNYNMLFVTHLQLPLRQKCSFWNGSSYKYSQCNLYWAAFVVGKKFWIWSLKWKVAILHALGFSGNTLLPIFVAKFPQSNNLLTELSEKDLSWSPTPRSVSKIKKTAFNRFCGKLLLITRLTVFLIRRNNNYSGISTVVYSAPQVRKNCNVKLLFVFI